MLFRIVRICSSLFKCNYLKNEKLLLNFLFHWWNLHQILNIFVKRMILIATVFSRLQIVKNLFKLPSKNHCFRHPSTVNMLIGVKYLWNLHESVIYHIFSSLWLELIWKISPFLKFEILDVFVNALTPDDKYPVRDSENLQFPVQMKLSQKRKLFVTFLFYLWNLHQILNILGKKMTSIANLFPRLQTVKSLIKPLSQNHRFTKSFDSQKIKGSQTLMKSPGEIFYHIFWSFWGEITWKTSPLLNFEILGVFINTLIANVKYPVADCQILEFPIQMQLS